MRKEKTLGSEAFPGKESHKTPMDRRGSLARELLVDDGLGERLEGARQLFDMEAIGPGPLDQRRELGIGGAERADYSIGINHASMPIKVSDRVGFEPTKRLPVYALSRRVPSAARPPIHLQLGVWEPQTSLKNGWGGIRTHDALTGIPVFETGSFSHSDTHPNYETRRRVGA